MNRLSAALSPYLLQHQHNPVDWHPWNEEALEQARQLDRPIFLSVGYAACHWCHVMAHESFEDPQTAAFLNEHFISIKVDREERPDIDSLYMNAVVAMTGQGGWPLTVFLTPEGQPFYGGTYFPPTRRYGMPAFQELLAAIAEAWQRDRPNILASADRISTALQASALAPSPEAPADLSTTLQNALGALQRSYDWQHGGWGSAPKFPQPQTLRLLLQSASQGDPAALETATHALRAMARGGLRDLVGGGFARYSVDGRWEIPHFEKMLYDNAQLSLVYLYAYLLTEEAEFRSICLETLDFVLAELQDPEGGFYSSLDADSEGEEGKYYRWHPDELRQHCPPSARALIWAAFGLAGEPNFEGYWVLRRALTDEALAAQFDLPLVEVQARLAEFLARLNAIRPARIRPGTDDKVLVSWNGLMISALAEAGRLLGQARYLAAAQTAAGFILDNLGGTRDLRRAWRGGVRSGPAFLEDHAALGLALLDVYQADANPRWYRAAVELAEVIQAEFSDQPTGFFDTGARHESLIVRPKDLQDNATPCGNSLTAQLLLRLARYSGQPADDRTAELALQAVGEMAGRHPLAFGNWLCAFAFATQSVQEVALVWPPNGRAAEDLAAVYNRTWRPFSVLAASAFPPDPTAPALLQDRPLLDNRATAYVCHRFVCQAPTQLASELARQLD